MDLIVDSFAGGGGASLGIEWALGRSPDIAINHDAHAIAMHAANHPATRHLETNVWRIDPQDVTKGRRVGLLWASPDCRHFSKAKGCRPAKRNIRDLAWVVVLWAKRVRPAVICLENVEEFRDWGPVDMEGRPCLDRRGETFRRWVGELRRLGYRIEWAELRGCDYGAPTIRKRMVLIARCDGRPIIWPEPTHGAPEDPEVIAGRKLPWRTAAEIIDWSLPCYSIFLTREEGRAVGVKRPLADATMARIARGVKRYVLESAEPFFVTYAQHSGSCRSGAEPLHTVTASRKDQNAIVVPTLAQTGYGERAGQAPRSMDIRRPLGTVVAGGCKHALVAAFLAQHNTGVTGHPANRPVSTITGRGTQQQLVAAHLTKLYGTATGAALDDPAHTVTAGGGKHALVAAFLDTYYGTDQAPDPRRPVHTVTTKDRHSIVTVTVDGQAYALVDIGMRMLTPRELFRAQGFPDSYVIDPPVDGRRLTKTAQIRCCGNSVCPQLAQAIVRANCAHLLSGQSDVTEAVA